MNPITNAEFGDAVTTLFKPIATRAGLEMQELRAGIYQIAGASFVLRIRRGIGHRKDFLITLSRLATAPRDLDDLRGEIGLSVIAQYHGVEMPYDDISSAQAFYSSLRRAAETTEQICLPYLTGQKSDFDEIRSFIDRKSEAIVDEPFTFPPNVREEWL